jgi:Phage tail sheath C-terminal domain
VSPSVRGSVLPDSYDEDVVDRRNASEWLHPAAHIDELPHRPVAIRADDPVWKYVQVRRLGAYVEHSIDHGLQWVVFEPNDEQTWANVRRQVEDFLFTLWQDGRLAGTKPEEAYFVKVDRSTMTQEDIDSGRLVVLVGIAPVRPAEFVIIRIGQWALGSDDDDD